MSNEYQRLTSAYRLANSVEELEEIFKREGQALKQLILSNRTHSICTLETYIYFYKKLTNEPYGDGKFKNRDKRLFINKLLEKAGSARLT